MKEEQLIKQVREFYHRKTEAAIVMPYFSEPPQLLFAFVII